MNFDIVIDGSDPTNIKSRIMSQEDYTELWTHVQELFAFDPRYDYREQERFINEFLVWALIWNNVMTLQGYKRILVVPSFKNSNFPTMWDDNKQKVYGNLVNNLWVGVKKYFRSHGEPFVCFPNTQNSFARQFMRSFDVSRIECNKPYILGDEDFTIVPPVHWGSDVEIKFDAVFLAGIPSEGNTYDAEDIKADFAQYCTEDFDLIDAYEGNSYETFFSNVVNNKELDEPDNRIVGESKDLTNISEIINSTTINVEQNAEGFDNLRYILPRLAEFIRKEFKIY